MVGSEHQEELSEAMVLARAVSQLPRKHGLLTTGQVARELGWSVDRVRRWIRRGKLVTVRFGRRVYVVAAQLPRPEDADQKA